MITLINKSQQQIIRPTMFPDGTSQVWKLNLADMQSVKIVWDFEQEAELIWVNQLIALLMAEKIAISELFIPYLPYARQDKPISNTATFAKSVFLSMLNTQAVAKISTLDAHSECKEIVNYSAHDFINQALDAYKPDIVVFPDNGANHRYNRAVNTQENNILVLNKNRNQMTGEITGLGIEWSFEKDLNKPTKKPIKCLIIDDICDGGATFNQAALFLHQRYNCQIALYVTHGIFSKGFDNMIASGISTFYTTQSLKKNKDGFAIDALITGE